jgi:hypothetical protein
MAHRFIEFQEVKASWKIVVADTEHDDFSRIEDWIESQLTGRWSYGESPGDRPATTPHRLLFAFEKAEDARRFESDCQLVSSARRA